MFCSWCFGCFLNLTIKDTVYFLIYSPRYLIYSACSEQKLTENAKLRFIVIVVTVHLYSLVALAGRQRRELSVFASNCHLPTCLPHTVEASHCPCIAGRQAGKLSIPIFKVFGLTRPGSEPVSTVSVADALLTRPLISLILVCIS